MTKRARTYDISDAMMWQLQWQSAQDPRARQRERAQRTTNLLAVALGFTATLLAIFDTCSLVVGLH